MKLRDLYETSVRLGMALDVRGSVALEQLLRSRRREFEALPELEQRFYDRERLRNPFGDVRIANGPDDVELHTVLLGINIGVPELLLADQLRASGTRIDAVIAHHTNGIGVAASLREDIMSVNIDYLVGEGVAPSDAERCIDAYIHDSWLNLEDFNRIGPDTARLLNLPLACIHTPADYYIGEGARSVLAAASPETVGDVAGALYALPEVQGAARAAGAGPRVMSGDERWPAGRVMLKFGGGRILPPDAYPLLGAAGVNTVVQIGCGPAHAKTAQAAGVAIVRLPHAAADNVGLNLLLDDVEKIHGPLEVIPCHAFERIRRTT
ncbi:MAG: hypothetical protein ACRDJN_11945 [Chloroflexota bacterium]